MDTVLSFFNGEFTQHDGQILIAIQDFLIHDAWTPVAKFITTLGNGGFIWIILTVLLLLFRKTRKVGMMSGIALVLSLCVTNLWLKEAIGRTRPYDLFDGVRLLVERQPDPSFPSGHASASFAATVPMMKELPKALGFLVLILALLISVSRLYVGVHYLSDVLVGAVLGTVYALIACAFVNAADRKRSGRIAEGRRFKAK